MSIAASIIQYHAKRLVAIAIILGLLCWARLPALSATERTSLADQFRFTRLPLPELTGHSLHFVRQVHPSVRRHSAWISAVGASVALNDLDGDDLSNDICYVDTRTNQVIVAPVPKTGERYQPFVLQPTFVTYTSKTIAPMGCLPGDLNEDGLMDILVYYWGHTPIAFLRSQKIDSNQLELSANNYIQREIASDKQRWYTNAATIADLDGDGHTDLIFGNYFPDDSEILNPNGTGSEQMQHSMTRASNGGRNRLLLWTKATVGENPTVEFRETQGVLDESIARGWTLAVGTADLDGDLLPEIYFANDFGPDRLLHNHSQAGKLRFTLLEGQKTLTTPNSKVLGRDSFKGMGVDFGDLNDDGLLDIYVSNIASEYALEESHFLFQSTGKLDSMQQGIAPYIDRSEPLGLSRSGWSWEARLGDFNNDGILEALQATGFVKGDINRWPELHELAIGNDELLSNPRSWPRLQPGDDLSGHQHNPFFVRAHNGRYYDLSQDLGLDSVKVSRGIATADVDGDGDLDLAIANQWESSDFYRNESPRPGAFLGIHLRLPSKLEVNSKTSARPGHLNTTAGRPAIGATATVHLPNGKRLVAQVDGGNGHSGARSPDLHFGLGQALPLNTQLPIDLHWRDLTGQVHQETLHLSPGWHTVLLGGNATGSDLTAERKTSSTQG
ncbi:RNA-binding protein [Scytonema hofmannii PCC 7110]|uniref:RNA-binding protein n=1 Tax=Scytonema hofmannii PCC 7110 TaxID=128403 RepID=A0A139XGG3_9CYAN|nr:CRTAC1 family protein [Scytonema hofmannii]KYC43743.1 RNA-binding protein [Scytonema hofmannii PCC 7110]